MNEPANFQPDDPVKFKLMNCTGKYNFPPYFPREGFSIIEKYRIEYRVTYNHLKN